MQPAIKLLEKVRRREVTTGVLVTDHLWTDLVEIASRSGLDYLIIDMEHGPHSPEVVSEACATGRRIGFPVLIRPRSNDYAALRLAIDLGCCGFLLACVDSAADLDVVRDAIYLPPRGRRRPGGTGNRWVSDFRYPAWRETVEDNFLVLPQIETCLGLANAAEIAGHEITTALAVGPYDLSAELGCCGDSKAPVLLQALTKIRETADAVKKPTWMISGNGAELVRDGWTFICIGEPTWILSAALKALVAESLNASPTEQRRYLT